MKDPNEFFSSLTQTQILIIAVATYATNLPLALLFIMVGLAYLAIPTILLGTIIIWGCAYLMNDTDRPK